MAKHNVSNCECVRACVCLSLDELLAVTVKVQPPLVTNNKTDEDGKKVEIKGIFCLLFSLCRMKNLFADLIGSPFQPNTLVRTSV